MPSVRSPEQLFEHELQDMYYAEQALTRVLPKLAEEATDRELSRAFTSHLKETQKQVANLEQVFRKIGKQAQAHPCAGIDGIKKEHDDFVSEHDTSAQMLDAFLTGAAARTEHYEIVLKAGEPAVAMEFPLGEGLKLAASSDKMAYLRVKLASKRCEAGPAASAQ